MKEFLKSKINPKEHDFSLQVITMKQKERSDKTSPSPENKAVHFLQKVYTHLLHTICHSYLQSNT